MPDVERIESHIAFVQYEHLHLHHAGILQSDPGCRVCVAL
jgi:hypothetical protein